MSAPTSRRAFLTSGTAALATAGAALPVVAATNLRDPVIEAVVARYRAADAAHDMTTAAEDEAYDRYAALGGTPPFPEAIYQTEEDRLTFHFHAIEWDNGTVERSRFKPTFIEHLRRNPRIRVRENRRPMTVEDGFSEEEVASGINFRVWNTREPWPEAQARAEEIVAAWDAREAEIARRDEVSGLRAADAAERAAMEVYEETRQAVAETPASNLAGVLLKARIVAEWYEGDPDDMARDIAGDHCLAGHKIGLSIVRDLLAIADRGA